LVWFGLSHFFPNQKLNCSVSAEISETEIETVYIGLVWFTMKIPGSENHPAAGKGITRHKGEYKPAGGL